MKTRFKLSAIEQNRKYRPAGYYEDVISRGQIIDDYVEMDHEQAVALFHKYTEKSPAAGIADDKEWGPILWRELHNRTKTYKLDIEEELRWLEIFKRWIPCGTCKAHWLEILKDNPPDLGSREGYIAWGILVHNIVNASLGKPIYVEPEAADANKDPQNKDYPSSAQMLATFSKSMAKWAKRGFKVVTTEQFNTRLEECKKCEFWSSKALAGTGRCKKCGCSTQAKLRLATEKCPIDKWGPVTDLNNSYEQPNEQPNSNPEPNPTAA